MFPTLDKPTIMDNYLALRKKYTSPVTPSL